VRRWARRQGNEEIFTLNSKLFFGILAAAAALLTPFKATCQIAPEKSPSQSTEPEYKYQVFVGVGYTSLNQVSQSNSGLLGVTASVTRDWGKYFGITLDGGHYQWVVTRANPEAASVNLYLAGPEFHAPLYEKASLFVHGLIGAAHTGGVAIYPNYSFAGGIGIGTPPVAMTNSFSLVAGIRAPSIVASGIYGDGTSSNGGIGIGMGSSGNLIALINGTTDINVGSFFSSGVTAAFYYSYDATTKIHRFGMNTTSSVSQLTGTATRTSQGASTVCYPFGEYNTGADSGFAFNRWILFNKAYLNGAAPSDDAAFTNLISTYATYI